MRPLKYLFFIISIQVSAETFYVTQSGAGSQNGSSIANAWSVVNFETSGNWGVSAGQIDAGDTVCFSGTVTTGNIDFFGDGTSGNPIVIDGECPSIAALNLQSSVTGGGFRPDGDDYLTIKNVTITANNGRCIHVKSGGAIGLVIEGMDCTVKTNERGIFIETDDSTSTITIKGPSCTLTYDGNWLTNSAPGTANAISIPSTKEAKWITIHNCTIDSWGHTAMHIHGTLEDFILYESLFSNSKNTPYGRALGIFSRTGNAVDRCRIFRNKLIDLRTQSKTLCKDTAVYNNYIVDIKNRCFSDTDTGCTYEYFIGGTNVQKFWYYGTADAWVFVKNQATFPITLLMFANNTLVNVAQSGFRNQINPSDFPSFSDNAYKIFNNVFKNNGNANTFSDSPPGSNNPALDGKTSTQYGGWAANKGSYDNNSFFAGETADHAGTDSSTADYTVANINADSYITNWTGDSNISTDPGITSGGYPDNDSDSIVDAGRDPLVTLSDPTGLLPSDGQPKWALDPSSVWPDNVSSIDQTIEGLGWEIGAFVFQPGPPTGIHPVDDSFLWVDCGGGITKPTVGDCP